MCMHTPIEPGAGSPEPERKEQFVLMHLTADGIRCPTCGRHHQIDLEPEDFWCGCGTPIVVVFAPCLHLLSA